MGELGLRLALFWRDSKGATGAEYALILGLIVVGIAGATLYLGGSLTTALFGAANCVESGCP